MAAKKVVKKSKEQVIASLEGRAKRLKARASKTEDAAKSRLLRKRVKRAQRRRRVLKGPAPAKKE